MLAPLIERNESMCVNENESYMDPINSYLKDQIFLGDKKQTKEIKNCSSLYYLEND